MSNLGFNEIFVWLCIAVMTGAPFFFRYWLGRYPIRSVQSIDAICSRLSTLIFAALFAGAFVFSERSQKTGEILLGAAILSFSILYQSRARYLQKPSSDRQNAERDALFRKFVLVAVGVAFALSIARYPVLLLTLLFYPFFLARVVQFRHNALAMAESPLKTKLKNIFSAAGTSIHGIYLIDSKSYTRNALIAGRSLFITLDLFAQLTDDEMTAVVSHEASHLKLRHSRKRVWGSFGVFLLTAYWFLLPTTLLFPNSPLAIFAVLPLLFVANQWYLSRLVRFQEMEADLGAVELGASSQALISALEKLSSRSTSAQTPNHLCAINNLQASHTADSSTRFLFGSFYPTPAERIEAIFAGALPETARIPHQKYAWAFSLLILGYTFHVANGLSQNRTPATISHLDNAVSTRSAQ